LSTVIDEPPKKRKKKQDKVFSCRRSYGPADSAQDSSKKGPAEKKAGKTNSGGLSKDDEAVSKLKVCSSSL